MKLLYLYRYGILGGVCTQLLHRLRHLDRELGIEVHCGFLSDHGVSEMLSPYATLHFGLNGENTASFLEEEAFDLVVVIDSEEYLQAIKTMENRPTLLVEVHTSIERNLSYLSRIQPNEVEGFFTVSEYMKTRIQAHASESLGSPQISLFSNVLDTDLFSPKSLNAEGPPLYVGSEKSMTTRTGKHSCTSQSASTKANPMQNFGSSGGKRAVKNERSRSLIWRTKRASSNDFDGLIVSKT